MAKNRKAFIASVVRDLSMIAPGSEFIPVYKKILEEMPQKQFEAYIERLRNGVAAVPDLTQPRELLTLVVPNMGKVKLDNARNLEIAEKWGHPFFEEIWVTDPVTHQTYLTNKKYLIIDAPVSRQAQTLDHKISVAKHNRQVDDRTNQSTGESKGASLSYPEVQILLSRGLEKTTLEMMKFRGGDETAFRVMNKHLQETGKFSQALFDDVDTRAKASVTASVYLKAMHLDNQL